MSALSTSTTYDPAQAQGWSARVNRWLDTYVLPWPVKFLTNRVVILATLGLLVPLIAFANATVFVLLANSYLNVMSVVVSSTVLLYATLSEIRDRAAAQRREEIAKAHEETVEQSAEADHQLIQQIHAHLDEMHTEIRQHVNQALSDIQSILVERLEKIQMADHVHLEETHKAVMASTAWHREELGELRALVDALHHGDFGAKAGGPARD